MTCYEKTLIFKKLNEFRKRSLYGPYTVLIRSLYGPYTILVSTQCFIIQSSFFNVFVNTQHQFSLLLMDSTCSSDLGTLRHLAHPSALGTLRHIAPKSWVLKVSSFSSTFWSSDSRANGQDLPFPYLHMHIINSIVVYT